jgi:hypothetical protein
MSNFLPNTRTASGWLVEHDADGVWVQSQRPTGLRALGKTADPERLRAFWATIPTLDVSVAELWRLLQAAATPAQRRHKPAVDPTFQPVDIGDGFGGHDRRGCARDGIGGPCWGQVEWTETRDLLVGRCQKALCMGHRGARYVPAPQE